MLRILPHIPGLSQLAPVGSRVSWQKGWSSPLELGILLTPRHAEIINW